MNDTIALIANLALALSFIVGIIFGIAPVRAAARDRRERLTLETLRAFQTREFIELLQFVNNNVLPANLEDMMKLPVSQQTNLIQLSQEMESLGILVAERLINIGLVDKTLGSFVTSAWEKYKILMMDMREKIPDPYMAEYFQWLAERLDERMQNKPRAPYYKTHTEMI
jgi:hypothetical protein